MTDNSTELDPDDPRPIPWYVLKTVPEQRSEDDNYAIVRSDGDTNYASTHTEAINIKADMESAVEHAHPLEHTVALIDLPEPEN